MKKENSEKLVLFLIFLVIIGITEFVFVSLKNGWFDKEKMIENNAEKSVIKNEDGTIELKNIIEIKGGVLDPKTLNVKIGELVSFKNVDENPVKIIGKDWQTPYLNKGAIFTKNDFKEGENEFYIDGKPDEIGKVIVK